MLANFTQNILHLHSFLDRAALASLEGESDEVVEFCLTGRRRTTMTCGRA